MKKWFKQHKRGVVGLLAVLLMSFALAGCSAESGYPANVESEVLSGRTETVHYSAEEDTGEPETEKQADPDSAETTAESGATAEETAETAPETALDPYGIYTSMEDVALYLYLYGELPDNFITKKEARALGWEGGSLEPFAPGMCIGGDKFGNYEGLLPEEGGRTYMECDIDTLYADSRGAKRIVYSSDGLIYYTEDHYESFELIYPAEDD